MKRFRLASPNRHGRILALLLCVVGLAACDAALAPLTPSPQPALNQASGNQPPTVDMGGPYTGIVGVPIQFDASKTTDLDSDYLYYYWQFSDNGPWVRDTMPTHSHTYQEPGTYNVTLLVLDHYNPDVANWVEGSLTVEVTAPGATTTGANVEVLPSDPVTGEAVSSVGLVFGNVLTGGTTTVAASTMTAEESPPAPVGFQLGDPPTYYDIKTTATFSGEVTVCIDYSTIQFTDESQLKLLHYENGAWVDITTSVDAVNKQLCGLTKSFSPFLVAQKRYPFTGFLRPLESTSLNTVKAGSGIPIKFGLGGNRGLQIFKTGSPQSRQIGCDGTEASGTVEPVVTAGKSGLSYDASTNQYIYAWQTEKGWAGTCRELVMQLVDGSEHSVRFKFTR